MKNYQTRFIPQSDAGEITNYYHLARAALSGQECTRYTRMLWAAKVYAEIHTGVTPGGAYKDLDGLLG